MTIFDVFFFFENNASVSASLIGFPQKMQKKAKSNCDLSNMDQGSNGWTQVLAGSTLVDRLKKLRLTR